MPPIPSRQKPTRLRWSNLNQHELLEKGIERMTDFCNLNDISIPEVNVVAPNDWEFSHVCAYYRPDTDSNRKWTTPGINICLPHCGRPCGEVQSRNWTWPGNTTDREPYGVICHELGHHCDYWKSDKKGTYFGDYGIRMREASKEPPISGYADNDHEWFAEMFRVFVTNPALLKQLRNKTYQLLINDWRELDDTDDWTLRLGCDVPDRVVKSLRNKGAK